MTVLHGRGWEFVGHGYIPTANPAVSEIRQALYQIEVQEVTQALFWRWRDEFVIDSREYRVR